MRLLTSLSCAGALLPGIALGGFFRRSNDHLRRGNQGCPFTISSTGSFSCPAGQLPDGQIRLNGTENTATFYISNGGITDSNGFGCIVTGQSSRGCYLAKTNIDTAPPTTQFQCDQGAAPDASFSIDAAGNLLYKGSPNFFACPATDTEYNVYVNPNFGQTKCFAITLQASGCGAGASSCAPVVTSTLWQTQTVTQNITQIVTITTTSTQACLPTSSPTYVPPPQNVSTICDHCSKKRTSTSTATRSI